MVTDIEGERRLPDLPQLESVRVNLLMEASSNAPSYGGAIVVAAFVWMIVPIIAAMLWGIITYWPLIARDKDLLVRALVALPVIVLGPLWLVYRTLFGDYIWQTTTQGFRVGSIARKRFVPWSHVSRAELRDSPLHEAGVLKVYAARRWFTLRAGRRSSRIVVSFWQHLRQDGKLTDSDLTSDLLAFWDVIPDEAPLNMTWENPKPSAWKGNAAFPLAMLALFSAMFVFCIWQGPWFFTATYTPMLLALFPLMLDEASRARSTARSLHVREHSFTAATPRGKVEGAWTDVAELRLNRFALDLKLSDCKSRVNVPLRQDDEQSEKVALAMVRAVRQAGGPLVIIPDFLRAPRAQPESSSAAGSARLPMSVFEIVMMPFPAAMFAAMFIGGGLSDPKLNKPLWLTVGIALAILAGICLIAAARYSFTADANGITKRNLWGSRLVRWQDASKIELLHGLQLHGRRLKLTDERGKVLLDERLSFGSDANRDAFWSFVYSWLHQTVPQVLQSPTWLARPWTPEHQNAKPYDP